MNRTAGILFAISSLPSKYGIGCFSKEAYRFVDWLVAAGQEYWQILPMGPTGFGDSPYQSFSTFAGNPYFIDLEALVSEGLLEKNECDSVDFGTDEQQIDYAKLYSGRWGLLRTAYERSNLLEQEDFHRFLDDNSDWIYDYSLFMAAKNHFGGIVWTEWPEDIRNRSEQSLKHYREFLADDIQFQQYIQYLFFKQWHQLRDYANNKGIQIIGDIPIYVALDSLDAWAHPELFQLDENGVPTAVAGCPPDGFTPDGQLWGNPLYDWEYHKQSGFAWWIKRLSFCFDLFDVLRIDHFRGFDEYYSIPYGEKTAVNGHWEKGPGMHLFEAVENAIGKKAVIAEDLGFVTDSVRQLVVDSGFAGMKLLEFAFDTRDTGSANDYLPHNYNNNCVTYTGTHDNETLIGWWQNLDEEIRNNVRGYLCDYYTPDDKIHLPLIALIMRSSAKICIIPIQDYFGLDNQARMNTPSSVGKNWRWRVKGEDLNEAISQTIKEITARSGRLKDKKKIGDSSININPLV